MATDEFGRRGRSIGKDPQVRRVHFPGAACPLSRTCVIAVEDIRASMKKVTDAGGRVLGEPMQIPGVGQYVSFSDTEGNRVSMLQPIPRNWHAPKSERTTARERRS